MRPNLWLLASVLATGIGLMYVERAVAPWEYYVNVVHGTTRSQIGDLYPSWYGSRELIRRGRNPYGRQVSDEIQMAYYGRVIRQEYDAPGVPLTDEQRFAYPVYVAFLLAPTTLLPFSEVQAWAPLALALMTAASVLLWVDVLNWNLQPSLKATVILFVLSSPQLVQGMRLRQLGLLVSFLLTLATWCISRNHLLAAGIILAFSTLKPQMACLPLAWFLLWSLSVWSKRWSLVGSFSLTLLGLAGVGEILLPRWPQYFFDGMLAYRHYSPTISPLALIVGQPTSEVLSIVVVGGLLLRAWRHRHMEPGSGQFVLTLATLLTTETLVMPLLTPFNHILLLLPLLMALRDWSELPRAWRVFFFGIVAWPFITSLILLLHRPRIDSLNRIPLLPGVAALLLPFLFAIFLARKPRAVAKPNLLIAT